MLRRAVVPGRVRQTDEQLRELVAWPAIVEAQELFMNVDALVVVFPNVLP